MSDIRDLFYSEGLSLYDTLSSNDVIGFLVPLYQRKYSWDEGHIKRILDDIFDGVISVRQDKESINFIGATIFVEMSVEAFRTKASSIVDGQQRLTTLILLSSIIHQMLGESRYSVQEINSNFAHNLNDKIAERLDELFACFAKSKSQIPKKSSDYYPIIIREHLDKWHKNPLDSNYDSPVADYLNQYIHFVYDNEDKYFSWNKKRDGIDINFFINNEDFIRSWLKRMVCSEIFDNIIENILNTKIGSELYGFNESQKKQLIQDYTPVKGESEINKAIALMCFSEYLLRKVAVTNVRVADERYGFEIFEALNTTGAPLTAIETFRPVVARYHDEHLASKGGYERSDSKMTFDNIDKYLDQKKTTAQKTKESQQIVVTFAYLARGEKIAEKLDVQRVCLKNWYEDIDIKKELVKSDYVKYLGKIAEFKENFWDKEKLATQLGYFPDQKEELLFHLDFLRDSKTTMAIPILLRFYIEFEKTQDITKFQSACQTIASFVAIWRSFTCNTGAIDSALKTVMSGGTANSNNYSGFKLGLDLNNKIQDLGHLKSFLKDLLIKKKIKNRQAWLDISTSQPLYNGSQELCKYLLLLAYHDSEYENINLVKGKARTQEINNYKKLSVYRSELFRSVEHVAPQNFAPEWDEIFDKDATTIHTIGNLTLLPVKENNAMGNKSWKKKKLFFEACATRNTDDLDSAIEKAKNAGNQFNAQMEKILRDGHHLSMAEHLCLFDSWDHNTVKDRSINIMECAWHELNKNIDL